MGLIKKDVWDMLWYLSYWLFAVCLEDLLHKERTEKFRECSPQIKSADPSMKSQQIVKKVDAITQPHVHPLMSHGPFKNSLCTHKV